MHIGGACVVRIDGPMISNGIPPALSIGGWGDVQVDAFGTIGGRFIVKESGRTGIGTNRPAARLHVADSSVIFSANGDIIFPVADPPISGAGRRMMWYSDYAAFRAGYVDGAQWDKIYLGRYSFSAGWNTIASELSSVALGFSSQATGVVATALGNGTIATGHSATALGHGSNASGLSSTAMGYGTFSNGDYSTALGYGTMARGYSSTAIGAQTRAKAYASLSIGVNNDTTDIPNLTTPASSDRIFQIGNGDPVANTRSNALTVLRDGSTGIGTTTPQAKLEVNGYTKLGNSSPKIQMKKLTGTTAATQGGFTSLVHGINSAKILSVDVLVEYSPNAFVPHSYRYNGGYDFDFYYDSSTINVVNSPSNSSQILSKSFRILITYEE